MTVGPDDTLLTAYGRMRLADVSQLPVLDDGKLVGIVDESDILLRSRARMTAAGSASTRRSRTRHDRDARTRCRPTSRSTRCCRSSTATRSRSSSTATSSSA